ncbi:MAG TPA: UbiA family prenyltransferase [Solirubrobacteraceae bacterium]|jgi:4-hydroxybenzoate polyprenyltransferase|nr:UbiA family prenyltransferase [Solirubrobacteraceae bacterium]
MSRLSALVRLVRLPAALTVPGDVLLGAAWGGEEDAPATEAALALGSSLLYLGGMALNDWADRELDARERPWRPIPAGEVAPAMALGSAIALTGGAIAVAGAAGGARRLRAVLALAATVWLYDLKMKNTSAGPWTMALARALDVLVGADRRLPAAGPPAAVVGAHTLLVTLVSAREVGGADEVLAGRALLGVGASTTVAATLILAGPRSAEAAALALACLALYGWAMGRAGVGALRRGDSASLQRMVGAGVLANMPLQAALLASRGRRAPAAALLAAWPAARWAGRRASVT